MSRPVLVQHRVLALWPVGLLLLEYLWVSVHFDARPLLEGAGLSASFGYLGIIAPLFVVVATLTYVVGGRALRGNFLDAIGDVRFGVRQALGVSINLASYVALLFATGQLLARTQRGEQIAWPLLAAWLCLAALSALALLFTLFPLAGLRRLGRQSAGVLALGCAAGALAWSAGLASGTLWNSMRALTLYTVHALMLPFCERIVFSPGTSEIGTPNFVVNVAPECSGIEGVGLIAVVIGIYLLRARAQLRFPRALWLLPFAMLAVWLGNAVRIALLIGVGSRISPEIALSGFHSKAGWLFFCGIALGLIAFCQRTRYFMREDNATATDEPTWSPTATHLAPLLALIATSLATALFSTGFDNWYGLRILAVAGALYFHRKHLPPLSWPISWHAPAIGLGVFLLWIWLVPHPAPERTERLELELLVMQPMHSALWITLRALGSIIAVPLAEELAFRGYLLRRLIDPDFSSVPKTQLTPLALGVSSVTFGLLHPGAWAAATLAGAVYALAQQLRGRTADAVVAHLVTNALIAADVIWNGAYWLWA
jgi:exosortase E/protease (VPEID-CTERM system)